MDALITDVQRFCMHDGPGIRTTVFFKGCPLHCAWCHNPETQSGRPQILFTPSSCIRCGTCVNVCPTFSQRTIPVRTFDRAECVSCGTCAMNCPTGALSVSGRRVPIGTLLGQIRKDLAFYGDDGGLTVSGGEPTAQMPALLSLLEEAKNAGISTCLETCGVFPKEQIGALCRVTDLFLYDLKDTDEARLSENTGASLSRILSNLRAIDETGGKTVLRCILIPGVNLNDAHRKEIARIYQSLKHCLYAELLPYHPFGTSKAERIGQKKQPVFGIPDKETVLRFAEELRNDGVRAKCFGT